MAFADEITRHESRIVQRMREALKNARAGAQRRRVYRETYEELAALSPRELDDLGISRENIRDVAHQAAYGY